MLGRVNPRGGTKRPTTAFAIVARVFTPPAPQPRRPWRTGPGSVASCRGRLNRKSQPSQLVNLTSTATHLGGATSCGNGGRRSTRSGRTHKKSSRNRRGGSPAFALPEPVHSKPCKRCQPLSPICGCLPNIATHCYRLRGVGGDGVPTKMSIA
jgi:hypothetical protein